MGKTIVALTLVVLLALATGIVCAGEQMTVREYAETCGDIFDDFGGVDVFFRPLDANVHIAEEVLNKLKGLSPPEELDLYHRISIELLKEFINVALGGQDLNKLREIYEESDQVIADLSSQTIRILKEEGCK